jgi:DNA recombination-dependent growth factor C
MEESPLGAIKGSISYTRFFVWGELPEDLQDSFVRAIRKHTFVPLAVDSEEEEHFGWCSIHHPFDLELSYDKVFSNNYLNLALRIDRWRIPAPVFKAHFAEASQAYLEKKQREKLNRREKEDLKVLVTKRLRKQVLPTMKLVDLSWDLDANLVRFWSSTKKMHELLHELFEDTFDLKLVPAGPYTTAVRVGITERQARAMQQLEPSAFHGSGRT